jgi:Raf kinase inhibitor-like YbhB/YbcL family protein
MKKVTFTLLLMLLSSSTIFAQKTFTLSSKDLGGQATKTEEFAGFGCTGKNQSPQLSWSNAPEGTKSFAITMYDPDAPTGSGWWHWIVFDIPSDCTELITNAGNTAVNLAPKGTVQSITNFGTTGYGGPCPPENHGIHQYIITIYALKTDKLGLDATANPAIVGYYLWMNTLSKASIVTYYQRGKK